jgi:hypothetical protein
MDKGDETLVTLISASVAYVHRTRSHSYELIAVVRSEYQYVC